MISLREVSHQQRFHGNTQKHIHLEINLKHHKEKYQVINTQSNFQRL